MTKMLKSRFTVPVTVIAAGSVVAGAVAVGHTWRGALITELMSLAIAVAYYVATGRDSDAGAIYGQRTDERQEMVRMNATRYAFIVMICAAFVCVVVTVALHDSYWQADVIGSLGALTYLLGIVVSGAHEHQATGEGRGMMDAGTKSGP